jgi:PPOX class probable F420-dependent enzyme
MNLDTTTEFGQRVTQRLEEEQVIWLTTVDSDGTPQPRPVWFQWDGETILIYSQPNTAKLRHIANNPQVALHFDSNGNGSNIVVFTGTAHIASEEPAASAKQGYIEKYRLDIQRIGTVVEQFASEYSVAIRVEVEKVRGH